jgi:hypothetical protein
MGEVRPIPTLGGVVRDVRGHGRALRVSWHADDGLVVLSLWDGARCTGTVRVAAADVPPLVEALQLGLRPPVLGPPPEPLGPPLPGEPGPLPGLDLVTGPADPADRAAQPADPGRRGAGQPDTTTGPRNRDAGPEGDVAG